MPIATSNDMNSQWKDVNTNTTTNDDDRKQKKSKKRRIKELNDKIDELAKLKSANEFVNDLTTDE